MTESPPKDNHQTAGPHDNLGMPENKDNLISTPRETLPTTPTKECIYIDYTYTSKKDSQANIRVNSQKWKAFQQICGQTNFSASEIIDAFISSIVDGHEGLPSKPSLNFNISIAKAESNPVINIGDFVIRKQLDSLLRSVAALKERADRERKGSDEPTVFTKEKAKQLEDEILSTLCKAKTLSAEKMQEIEFAFSILKSIRGFA